MGLGGKVDSSRLVLESLWSAFSLHPSAGLLSWTHSLQTSPSSSGPPGTFGLRVITACTALCLRDEVCSSVRLGVPAADVTAAFWRERLDLKRASKWSSCSEDREGLSYHFPSRLLSRSVVFWKCILHSNLNNRAFTISSK